MIYKTWFTCFLYVLAEKKISNFKIMGDKYIEGKIKGAFLFQKGIMAHTWTELHYRQIILTVASNLQRTSFHLSALCNGMESKCTWKAENKNLFIKASA